MNPLSRQVRRRGRHLAAALVLTPVLLTLLLRFVPPPVSGLMIQRAIQAALAGEPYQQRYQWRPLSEIAPVMGVAVIAAEDQRFAEHAGFDWRAISQAIAYNQRHHKTRGASTISQQTAKNLFLWDGRNWLRKGLEAGFTVLIECLWSKERILAVYLNIVEFGDGIYGVEAASQAYFHKPAARLSASEAALLAAVLPNPHHFHVDSPSASVRTRQQWILANMRRLGGTAYLQDLD